MKKILIISIILVTFSCSASKPPITKVGKEDIGNLKGNLKHGKWNSYNDGKLISTGNYSNNQKNGTWKFYYATGTTHQKGKFMNDKQNGIWNYYFESGQFMGKGELINGEQNGLWRWFYKNGKLYTERIYDHGKLLEIRSCFDKNGVQLDCGRVIDGNGIMISHDLENNTNTIEHFEFVKGILKEK